MKLHLPIALLTAVVCSMAFVQAEDTPTLDAGTYSKDGVYTYKYKATYDDASGYSVEADFSGDGTKGEYINGSAYKDVYIKSSGTTKGNLTDIIAGLPVIYKNQTVDDVKITVSGKDTKLGAVSGIGPGAAGFAASGDKTIIVTEGATVGVVYGGSYDKKGAPVSAVTDGSDAKISIEVTEGAKVTGYIVGSSFTSYNNPVTCKESVSITIDGGSVGNGDEDASDMVILGAMYATTVGNSVKVLIKDTTPDDEYDTHVYGSIFGGAYSKRNEQLTVDSTSITVAGGTITGDVYGGGTKFNDSYGSPKVKNGTQITLSGGQIKGDVYGAGDKDIVENGTNITISGAGTEVGGTIYGGGANGATVTGDRTLTVKEDHDSTTREEGYKLADFTAVNVDGDIKVESLEGAKVTEVTVGEEGSISTKAGALSNLKSLKVKGALTIDMSDAAAGGRGVTCDELSLDGATINVVATGAGASDSISVFAFNSSNENAGNFTLTMNGSAVDEDLWGFKNGVLFIKEASTTTLNLNRNQSRFHDALRAMQEDGNATPELSALATSRDADEVKAGLDALSGHEYATAMSSQIEGNLGHLRRLRGAMGKGTALGSYVVSPGSKGSVDEKGNEVMAATPAVTDVRNWRVGVSAFHEETEIDSDARGDGYDRSETGAMLTAEYYMNKDLTLGGAISYGRTNLRTDGAMRRHEDNTRFDVYALYGKKRWSFATSLGLGVHEHELKRDMGRTDVDGYSINFLQDAAYTVLSCDDSNVQVFGTVESSWNEIDSFSDGMVSGAEQDAWATDVTVGLRYNRALRALGNAPAGVFTAQTGVTASIGDVKSGVDMSIGGYGYRQESATRNRWGWNLGAGVDVPVRSNMSVYGAVDAVIRGDSSSVDGQIGVKVSF